MLLAFIYSGDVNPKKVNDNTHNIFNSKYLFFSSKNTPPPKKKKIKNK